MKTVCHWKCVLSADVESSRRVLVSGFCHAIKFCWANYSELTFRQKLSGSMSGYHNFKKPGWRESDTATPFHQSGFRFPTKIMTQKKKKKSKRQNKLIYFFWWVIKFRSFSKGKKKRDGLCYTSKMNENREKRGCERCERSKGIKEEKSVLTIEMKSEIKMVSEGVERILYLTCYQAYIN